MKLGVLIYTYNRTDDAKINMEIIRNEWSKSPVLKDTVIIHAYNGKKEWYPKKYIEDDLIRIKNSWHFQGASDLIDAGMKRFKRRYKDLDYIIVLAADTWLANSKYVEKTVKAMQTNGRWLATCAWGLPERNNIRDVGIATDFMIVDAKWATKNKMFPVQYKNFYNKYAELFMYEKLGNVTLEKLMLTRYVQAVNRSEGFSGIARKVAQEKILLLTEREPVHSHKDEQGFWQRNMHWPEMGLLTHHEPHSKKEILKSLDIQGERIEKLITSENLDYFNHGITKMKHNCN